MPDLSYEEISKLLKCNPETGKLFWLERPREMFRHKKHWTTWNRHFARKEAFTANHHGYKAGVILGKKYVAHRVVWMLVYGEWPRFGIDHIDGNRSNNKISNLRDVPTVVNARNVGIRKDNISGYAGVNWCRQRKKWRASVTIFGKQKELGRFETYQEAVEAKMRHNRDNGFTPRHGVGASVPDLRGHQ